MDSISNTSVSLLAFCLFVLTFGVTAQAQPSGAEYYRNSSTGRVVVVKPEGEQLSKRSGTKATAATAKDRIAAADSFFEKHGAAFGAKGPNKDLWLASSAKDKLGMSHAFYLQTYNDLPVLGGDILVHFSPDSKVSSANGNFVPDIKVSTAPALTVEQAEKKAREAFGSLFENFAPTLLGTALYIVNPGLFTNRDNTESRLAWEIRLFSELPSLVDESFYVDAQNGEILAHLSAVRQVDLFRRIYDCSAYGYPGPYCYVGWSIAQYPDHIFGRRETEPARGPNPLRWGSLDVDTAWELTGEIDTMYSEKFGRDGGNKRGGLGNGASTSSPLGGTHIFTHWEMIGIQCLSGTAYYYDRVNACTGFITPDLLGHEYSHSVGYYRWSESGSYTDSKYSLVYSGQSGALDENWADIGGEMLEKRVTGITDWQPGTDFLYGTFRSMKDPTSIVDAGHHQPDRFNHPWVECGDTDNGGVHLNANVMNKAAYLLSEGGDFNGCRVIGIGMDKMAQIFYRAINYYYSTTESFNSAYYNLIQSCTDLYGASSNECAQLTVALQAVELNQGGRCSGITPQKPACVIPELDQCPTSSIKAEPGVCGCDVVDQDSDGDYSVGCAGVAGPEIDCNDNDSSVYPGAVELCDGKDNDCDGLIDEDTPSSPDADGDGYTAKTACSGSQNDPDDSDRTVYPGASEACDNKDNDVDGYVDELFFPKADCSLTVDGTVIPGKMVCNKSGTSECSINGKTEVCDGLDNDYNGEFDEGFNVSSECTSGFGACQASGTLVCDGLNAVRCDAVPGSPTTETCDGIDNDCDGTVDEDFNLGASCTVGTGACQATGALACGAGGTAVCSATAGTPSDEICDGIDNDCDGEIDEDLVKTCGPAASGVGICQAGTQTCSAGAWGECSGAVYPATEICGNGIDEDCNGSDLACPASCTDSDGGKLPKVYGEVTYNGTVYKDRCLNRSTLREGYCASARYVSSSMYCASGCANGKCK